MQIRQRIQKVSNVEKGTTLLEEIPMRSAIEQLVKGPIESCSAYSSSVVGTLVLPPNPNETPTERLIRLHRGSGVMHPFVGAVHAAYQNHRPLILSPDMFWLLIIQGLAQHINHSPEKYREQFVAFSGKTCLEVHRDDFIKGALENTWEDVFSEFSAKIQQHVGDRNYSSIVAEFSTTGRVEKAAFEIVLMDCVQSYFKFVVHSLCGIPEVILEGEPEDWARVRNKTQVLGAMFDANWWTDELVPVLDLIAENADGRNNPELWENIYKDMHFASGNSRISGWIIKFFPYLSRGGRNSAILEMASRSPPGGKRSGIDRTGLGRKSAEALSTRPGRQEFDTSFARLGISAEDLPGSLSRVPFLWNHVDDTYNMEFLAGFMGYTQDPESLAVRPKIGWAVREVQG
jgi:hypothetical protein